MKRGMTSEIKIDIFDKDGGLKKRWRIKEKEERRIGWSYFSIYGGIKDGIFQARYLIFYHIEKRKISKLKLERKTVRL